MLKRLLIVWFAMLIMASVNGGVREAFLVPMMGPGSARVVSTLLLCAIVFLLTYVTIEWIDPRSPHDAWVIGGLWVALTLAFEFLAGHYLFGNPWSDLFAEYNVFRGRIWILAVITILVAPTVCARARERVNTPR
jgi:hypothetical protein